MRSRTWVEVDLGALATNIRRIAERIDPARLLVVIKKDAYGHGLHPVARTAEEAGVDCLGVACVSEGVALRAANITAPILNLGLALPDEIEAAVADDVELTVASLDDARRIGETAGRLGRTARVHLKIDTGMGRLGLFPEQLLDQIDAMADVLNIEWAGLYSHLVDGNGDPDLTGEQLDRFKRVAEALAGWIDFRHLGASAAIAKRVLHFDMLRVGIGAFGADASLPEYAPVMSFKSRLIFIKDVPSGRTISYGATYTTSEPTRVGVVAAGYGNGYPRLASNRGHVLIDGRPAAILGRVCMDQLMVNLNDHAEAQVGDSVLLFGREGEVSLPVWQVAEWAETIAYETLCCVGMMNTRVYRDSASPGGNSDTGAV